MTALVIAEHDHGALKGATLNTVTAAAQLGGEVHLLIAGQNAAGAAQAAAQLQGKPLDHVHDWAALKSRLDQALVFDGATKLHGKRPSLVTGGPLP